MNRTECLAIISASRAKGEIPNLSGANLSVADLSEANLSRAHLTRADLSGADLYGANLSGANISGANISGANLSEADLSGANLSGANISGANLSGANISGADLYGANLSRADLSEADLSGCGKIARLDVFSGLYKYQCWAVVTESGVPWVRMGCLLKPIAEWEAVGIRNSNPSEFPDDGSEKCEQRVRAFEFTRAEALRMAEKCNAEKQACP